jgi:alpha-L-rhamnosidase
MITATHLTCEYFSNPLGIDVLDPRLSWKLGSDARDVIQSAYQLRVAANEQALTGSSLTWDSGNVISEQSLHVMYGGPALQPGQRYYWQVRVWGADGVASDWSETAFWEMGLVEVANWQAEWITPDWDEDIQQSQPAPYLRKTFALDGAVQSARIYVTSLGLYELQLNGQRVGEGVLTPGWTVYDRYLQYQTYDVTGLLTPAGGENAIGAILGDGWYRGWLGFEGNRNTFGDHLALLLQLEVTYTDGRKTLVCSDGSWRATTGPLLSTDVYMGEIYDATLELPGWAAVQYDDSAWKGVRVYEHSKSMVGAQVAPFVTRQEELKPVKIITTPAGETVYDFGQNMVGWVRLKVSGPAGTVITLRHAEVLDQKGNMYLDNLRTAKQLIQYILKGEGVEVFEPRFTFMGFQFVRIEGLTVEASADMLTGIVVHSEIPSTGEFECSSPLINQLQHNIVWGQKGNFVDVPTDCPQRDERLGWTGDAQVFIRTATFNRDVAAFFTKWLRDLAADQKPSGSVPMVIPDVMGRAQQSFMPEAASAAWADAAVICPWTIYLSYGDKRILEAQYESMAQWIGYMRNSAGETHLWTKGFHFGDWLDYRGRGEMDAAPITDKELIASAFFAYSTSLMQKTALVLGNYKDAGMYGDLLGKIKDAFVREYVSAEGRVAGNSQTAYVLALHFDLLPEDLRPKAAARLAEEVKKYGYHLTTGFVGTPYLCSVLSRFGHTDLAYELLNQETFPSWLYPVKMGATTIWERWDGIKPDGSFQDVGMNSFNHYSYGAIGEWMYRVAAGIELDPQSPGYKHSLIQPEPGGGLTHVRAALETPYGRISSAWQLSELGFDLQVSVPVNTTATVRIPSSTLAQVQENGKALAVGGGIHAVNESGGCVVLEVGSGSYEFTSTGLTLSAMMANVRHVAGRLDIGVPVRELLANEKAKAALVAELGEDVVRSANNPFIANATIEALVMFAPQLLTPEKLQAVQNQLIAIQ